MNYDMPATNYKKASEVVPPNKPESEFSWLGRWKDNGWSVRIEPRLAPAEWDRITPRLEETFSETLLNYDPMKSLELLQELLPKHMFTLIWPRCGYRKVVPRKDKRPLIIPCNAVAQFSHTNLRDVYDNKTTLARCEEHRNLM